MKRYRSVRDVYSDIERALAAEKPRVGSRKALERAAEILSSGRVYGFVSVSLDIEGHAAPQAQYGERGNGRVEIDVPIKLVQRELGTLCVRSEHAFAAEDRVLLKNVARALARFLTGKGKYIVRKAREQAAAGSQTPRGYQPSSERPTPMRRVAAGEKS